MITGNIRTLKKNALLGDLILDYLREIEKAIPAFAHKVKLPLADGAYIAMSEIALGAKDGKEFEAHEKFIDLQYVIEGTETIYVGALSRMSAVSRPYNPEKDMTFYLGEGDPITLKEGDFAIFFPEDAHMGAIGEGKAKKAIVKIPLSLVMGK